MKLNYLLPLGIVILLISCSAPKPKKEMVTELDSVSYQIGVLYGNKLKLDGLDSVNLELLLAGMHDALKEKSKISPQDAKYGVMEFYAKLTEKRLLSKYGDVKIEGERFLKENASRKEVQTFPDGLQYEVLKKGTGPVPDSNDVVIVHYRGQLVDGTVFEETYGKDPVPLGVNRVIKGWTEALLHMHVGDKWKIYVPWQLGYGSEFRPNSPILPYSTLIFEIELIDLKREP